MEKIILLTDTINEELSSIEKEILNCKTKLEDNYLYAFVWGYTEELFFQTRKLNNLKSLIDFIKDQPNRVVEWLEYNIKTIEDRLLNKELTNFSTSRCSNIAFELTLKADQSLRILYKHYLKIIR
jgi:hypothetical protein